MVHCQSIPDACSKHLFMLQGCEVPLHFACKHGFAEVVAVLISHPKTDKSVRNKYNETPKEVRKDKDMHADITLSTCLLVLNLHTFYTKKKFP